MHICHINLARGFSGGERQTLNLIRQLAGQGIRQTLIARPGNPLHEAVAELPVTVRTCSHFIKGHGTGGDWDLVHCHDGKGVYWGLIEYWLRTTPYVITRRVDNPLGTGWVTRQAYGKASRVACLSSAIQRVVLGTVNGARTEVIPSSFSGFPADDNEVGRIRQRYAGKLLIGQVGRFLAHKGHSVTLRAAPLLAERCPNAQILFLGEGPEEAALQQQAMGLDNVEFAGFQKDIGNWLAALDLLVFPSLQEGLGSTILEAMQHGVPVVAARAGGIPDILDDGSNGLLVNPGDVDGLADAVSRMLADEELRARLVEGGYQTLPRFSPERNASSYLALYRDILG
ncbi:glycosyltransferase family 4 protein [Marinobacter zhejiangensis]|uniref:Glycosyltransferase involved in cell wall bisynthesis n=1 Tax=Marinobacter zhejiangensis TaxID=488535 RepID=A0A1I4SCG2_9GAMM|nr:glycosyltransferase family 4 protein [Marinobacter zhejiangensis]SFM62020.1 Glycosyltransferase involved in cell wall bisynthesis [Marinobacter zhejiangensis]